MPIAEPAEPIRVPVRPKTGSINKVKSESKVKPSGGSGGSGGGSSSGSSRASYGGKNRMSFPALGINRGVSFFSCSNNSYPGNVVYRWGCAGSNNVYLFGHAHSVFKPLHDAYVNGRLRKGMKVSYADSKGKVRTYKLIWWKVTIADQGRLRVRGPVAPEPHAPDVRRREEPAPPDRPLRPGLSRPRNPRFLSDTHGFVVGAAGSRITPNPVRYAWRA